MSYYAWLTGPAGNKTNGISAPDVQEITVFFLFTAGELQGDFQANSELNQYLSDSETSQDHVFSRPCIVQESKQLEAYLIVLKLISWPAVVTKECLLPKFS